MLEITDFKNCVRVGPYDWNKNPEEWIPTSFLKPYRIPFYTTKFAEFDRFIPINDGIYAEFGVFKGTSLKYLSSIYSNLQWWGFDSFNGIAESWDWNSSRKYNMENFETQIPSMPKNCSLVIGTIQETLENWKFTVNYKPISFLNLDMNLYSSTIFALESLNEMIIPGTILRFDELTDWVDIGIETDQSILKFFPKIRYKEWRKAEWKALSEWLKTHNRRVKPLWRNWYHSAGLIVIQ